ncbi:MAG: penicillin-binding protein 2 [Pseudomonadota bacterium]
MLLYDRDNKRELKKRVSFCVVFATVAFAVIISRLWYLQIIQGKNFRDLSENNRIRVNKILAPRGMIFDRKNRVLVDNYPSFDLSIILQDAKDPNKVINELSALLNTKVESFNEKLSKAGAHPPFKPIILKTELNHEQVALIETNKLDLPGIRIEIEPKRFYLFKDLAAHLIGYMGKISQSQLKAKAYAGYDILDLIGKCGIEYEYQDLLRGRHGGAQVEVDAAGRELSVLSEVKPTPGHNLFLTLDLDIQRLAESALGEKVGSVIIMDPNNGDILALTSSPSFDPNVFSLGISSKEWKELISHPSHPLENKGIQGQYPLGSVFKIVTAIAGLEEGVITPETSLYCKGSYRFGRRSYRCWRTEGHGWVKLHKALVESCDVYFYQVGQRLGIDRLAYYSSLFGLGKPTGISLLNEKKGLVPTRSWKLKALKSPWQDGETLSVAIGQGFLLATPLQMLNLISSIANGGILYRPQLLKKIESPDGETLKEFVPEKLATIPIDHKNLSLVKNALWGVVNEPRGTGSRARVKGADVVGKTGTAQVIGLPENDTKTKLDDRDIPFELRDHAWFAAFAPKDNPSIAVVVMLEHAGHGGSAAAPLAGEIIRGALEILK